jgi:alginate O-acetyltransferase complex protein AlgI
MVFSSALFIFFFLPLFLLGYFITPKKYRNYTLLVFSLLFYAWGEPVYIILMLLSALINYLFSLLIIKKPNHKKIFLTIAIILNLSMLGLFKYADFLLLNVNSILKLNINYLKLSLPIGISFFTFQALSYTIDVYRNKKVFQKNYFKLLTYISMFPQLIAGPIVRYETIAKELDERETNFTKFSEGFYRFIIGLFKKVLIANVIGMLWDKILNLSSLSVLSAWLGALAFTLQIYYDFSGYSDMAIGLGKMIGFTYLENFNYPYIATSITDFWRRWHISLSSWFRDYVYIPLGGNRCSRLRHIRNIFIVWMLTGLWHGANYNFLLWGIYYGVILIIEKYLLANILEKLPKIIKHIYSLFLIMIGWIIFAIEDASKLISYLKTMFGLNGKVIDSNFSYLFRNYIIIIILGIIFSIPFKKSNNKALKYVTGIAVIILFIITITMIISDTYNPFLYFRF